MKEIFVIYNTATGHITKGVGKIDREIPPDGSTILERITTILADNPNLSVLYLPLQALPNRDTHKIENNVIVPRTITQYEINAAIKQEKNEEIASNPLANITLQQAEIYIENNVTNLATVKEVMKKIVKLILVRTQGE